MATYGQGKMLGSGINPESFKQDYSGFTRAADIQAQGMSNLGASIGGVIKDFGEAKEQRKKIDAETKASRAGIESAIKLGDALGFDVKGMLSPVIDRMDDPNTTPIEAAALGREASTQIANVLNLGFKAQDQEYQRASLMQDAAYKNEQLRIAQQNANSRAQAAIAAGGNAPPIVEMPLGDGSTQKMQWDRKSQSYTLIPVSGLGDSQAQQGMGLTNLVKGFEGFNPNAYNDHKQTSIGYGTKGVLGETITEEEASNKLQTELAGHAERIKKAAEMKGVSLNENQFNALTSFDYNTGRGANLIERFGDQPNQLAAKMLEYTKAGGQDLPGLVKRRQVEAALFLSPDQQSAATPQSPTGNQSRIGFTPAETKESEGTEMTLAEVEELTAKGVKVNTVPLGEGKFRVTESTFGNKPLVEVSTGETVQQERSKKMDAMLFETKKQLEGASQNKDSITKMIDLLDEGVKTGFARETIMKFNRAFGRDVSDAETFRSVAGDVAMGFINLTKGAISDREMTYFTTTLAPNLGNTPEGNKKIGEFMLKAIKKTEKIEEVISEGLREGKDAFDIDKEVMAIRNADDLLTDKPLTLEEQLDLMIKGNQ